MAREIYNKNAREKVLLEEAYTQVYTERHWSEGHPELGDLYKHPKYGKYLRDLGEYGRSYGPGNEPPNPTSPMYGLELSDAQVYRDAGYNDAAGHVEQAFGAESEEGGTFEGAYISGTDEVEPQPDLSQLEGSFQAKKNPSVKYQYRVSEGETIPSLEPNEQGQYVQDAPAGNIILTGHIKTSNTPDGEQWSQKPEKFEKDYKKVSETEAVAVGANPVAMRQLTKPFKVHTSWGSVLEGKPGDLLTMYGPNDYGVLDQDAFKAYYIKA